MADDSGHSAVAVLPGGGFVVLDTALTPELEAEGWARDLVRQIQDERKAAGLHVSDPIRLRLAVPEEHLGTRTSSGRSSSGRLWPRRSRSGHERGFGRDRRRATELRIS